MSIIYNQEKSWKRSSYFGWVWKGITSFRKHIKKSIFTDKIFGFVGKGVDRLALESPINRVMETKQSFLRFIEKVVILIGADFGKILGKDIEDAKLNHLKSNETIWKIKTSSLVFFWFVEIILELMRPGTDALIIKYIREKAYSINLFRVWEVSIKFSSYIEQNAQVV